VHRLLKGMVGKCLSCPCDDLLVLGSRFENLGFVVTNNACFMNPSGKFPNICFGEWKLLSCVRLLDVTAIESRYFLVTR
jgi:hypothetical protein